MTESPSLTVDMELRRRALSVSASFHLTAPWTCLFGPSGSGKTTILRTIAGFTDPDRGRIVLGGVRHTSAGGASEMDRDPPQILFDRAARICVKPHLRQVRSSPQQSWVFPGTVRENVAFGANGERARNATQELINKLDLAALAETRMDALSGGERRRVALARVLCAAMYGRQATRLLLLDEPFTGMDSGLRNALAFGLRDWLAKVKIPVLSVTHDVGEVFLLGAEVIRIAEGKVVAQGPAGQVLAPERTSLLDLLR